MPVPTEYDAQGKPITATAAPSSPATEYDASGQPINNQPHMFSAQPPSQHPVQDWLHNLNTDITEGGNRTLPARILGHMQGRGDQGYTGMNSGGQAATAQFMGSPVLGPIHTAQGVAETPQHPIMGPVHAAQGVMQTMAIPSSFMGGEGMGAAIESVPSRTHAVGMLKDIESAAKDVPVSMENTRPALGEFQQSVATGGKNAPVMTKLARRIDPPVPRSTMLGNMQSELNGMPIGAPEATPINFPEARDFYTNISRQTAKPGFLRSAIESPAMPSFRMEAGNVRNALHGDLTDAAGTIGRGEDYENAIKEYAQNAKLRNYGKKAALLFAPAAAGAVGASPAYKLLSGMSR